jgi:hypothetical protein
MDQTAPFISDVPSASISKYLSDGLIYVDYYPDTENTGDFPIPSFAYIGWDGKSSAMPSVNQKVRFRYMIDERYYIGTVDPKNRRFITSEIANHSTSSEYVTSNKMGPFIEVQSPQTGTVPSKKMYVAFYEKPRDMIRDTSPDSRTDQVYKHGTGILFDHWTLILILILVILTFSLIYGSNPHMFEVMKMGEVGILALE